MVQPSAGEWHAMQQGANQRDAAYAQQDAEAAAYVAERLREQEHAARVLRAAHAR